MTMFAKFRAALARRAAYIRTRDALSKVPSELALEDLGFWPGDAKAIAHRAVYG